MANVIIKSDERRAAEARTLREYGINTDNASAQKREYAEHITAAERGLKKEFDRMEGKSK